MVGDSCQSWKCFGIHSLPTNSNSEFIPWKQRGCLLIISVTIVKARSTKSLIVFFHKQEAKGMNSVPFYLQIHTTWSSNRPQGYTTWHVFYFFESPDLSQKLP